MEWAYKTKTVNTKALKYAKRIRIASGKCAIGEGIWISLYTMSGECYCDITKEFGFELEKGFGYVEANSDAERFVIEQNLGADTKVRLTSGFNTYNLYKFTNEKLLKI